MPFWSYILTALAAYLLGSIPTGFLVAKAKGVDIRAVGSGNIGATNAMRALGKPVGICVLLMDVAKGWLACFLGTLICFYYCPPPSGLYNSDAEDPLSAFAALVGNCQIIAGIFAVLGHNYTCWLKFKGGKGVATTAGVYLAIAPIPLGIALAVFILALLTTRYVSVASISGAIALTAAVWIWPPQTFWPPHNLFLGIVTTALGALAVYKHKSNIQRLMAGTENRLGRKSQPPEEKK